MVCRLEGEAKKILPRSIPLDEFHHAIGQLLAIEVKEHMIGAIDRRNRHVVGQPAIGLGLRHRAGKSRRNADRKSVV